jgi:hypothetical protein
MTSGHETGVFVRLGFKGEILSQWRLFVSSMDEEIVGDLKGNFTWTKGTPETIIKRIGSESSVNIWKGPASVRRSGGSNSQVSLDTSTTIRLNLMVTVES